MKLAEIVYNYRMENGISQRELARRANMSNSSIAIIEKGISRRTGKPFIPPIKQLKKLASAMGTTVHDLCLQADDMEVLLPSALEVYGPSINTPVEAEIIELLPKLKDEYKEFILVQIKALLGNE